MTDAERERVLFEIRKQEFTNAMHTHGCLDEDRYYFTEILVMWDTVGADDEHLYLFNEFVAPCGEGVAAVAAERGMS